MGLMGLFPKVVENWKMGRTKALPPPMLTMAKAEMTKENLGIWMDDWKNDVNC